ncbi:uncharacterized protein LOC119685297 [Teleopsis dalmanni]|uniref:uncharacterized protein LOC119685297 n=1 Tax=Teleopsis dalmanni TaxID=139649 RepID=UPI0018CE06BC|nr:uncharacterized protein LOC119685297 [Teleopsis dalmanni]
MFQIYYFEKTLCRYMRKLFGMVIDGCEVYDYSIWYFEPIKRIFVLKDNCMKLFCSPEWFPVSYWIVVILGLVGCMRSFNELNCLIVCGGRHVSTWRQRTYRVLPNRIIRQVRVVTACLMLLLWASLLYGVVLAKPIFMQPLIYVNNTTLLFDLAKWIYEISCGHILLDLTTLSAFFAAFLSLINIWCVQNVLETAILENDFTHLKLIFPGRFPNLKFI